MNPRNKAFRVSANRQHWFSRNVLAGFILPMLFLLVTLSLPQIAKPVRAELSKERRNGQKLAITPCSSKSVRPTSFKERLDLVSTLPVFASAPRPKPRPVSGPPQACGESEFECKGTLCYHQCLACPSGWTVNAVSQCCAQCCQGLDNCGDVSCCTPTF
jgi:hypothetical protein